MQESTQFTRVPTAVLIYALNVGVKAAADFYLFDLATKGSIKKRHLTEAAVVKALAGRKYVQLAQEKARDALKEKGYDQELYITKMGEGTIDDFGVWWCLGPELGEYAMNYKREATAKSRSRLAKEGAVIRVAAGSPKKHTPSTEKLAIDSYDAFEGGRRFGAGVLAIIGSTEPRVAVYDWMWVYRFDAWNDQWRPAGPIVSDLPTLPKRVTSTYIRETGLLQVSHDSATTLYEQLVHHDEHGDVFPDDRILAAQFMERFGRERLVALDEWRANTAIVTDFWHDAIEIHDQAGPDQELSTLAAPVGESVATAA